MSDKNDSTMETIIGWVILIAVGIWLVKFDGCSTIKGCTADNDVQQICQSVRDDCEDDCSAALGKRENALERCNEKCKNEYMHCLDNPPKTIR